MVGQSHFFFKLLRKSASSAKTCVTIAQAGSKAISASSSLEQEELVFTALSILDRLGKAKLLRTSPFEVEKMWFNFARKVCAAGHYARSQVYTKHLLVMLAVRADQENAEGAFQSYLPLTDDPDARVHLSACAFACYSTALAETDAKEMMGGGQVWSQATAWVARVADAVKREALQVEMGRVLAAALRNISKSSSASQQAIVRGNVWCLAFVVCANSKSAVPLLRDCFANGDSVPVAGPVNEAVMVMCAKKMEEFRKLFVAVLPSEQQTIRRESAAVLLAYTRTLAGAISAGCPRHDKLEPFVVEAVGTVAIALAELDGAAAAERELKEFEGRLTSSVALSSKYYNVGVALYSAGKVEDACGLFASCCRLLQAQYACSKRYGDHFSERHVILAQCLERCGKSLEALDAAVWALCSKSCVATADLVVRQWQNCEVAGLAENAMQIADRVTSSELRWQLLDACNGWRPLVNVGYLMEALLSKEKDHPRALVERGRLEKARGNVSEARTLFESAEVGSAAYGHARFWLAVLELENGDNVKGTVELLNETTAWLQEHLEAGSMRIAEGLLDVLEWLDRPTAALSLASQLAEAFPTVQKFVVNAARLRSDAEVVYEGLLVADELVTLNYLSVAEAQLAAGKQPDASMLLNFSSAAGGTSFWVRSRMDYICALAAEQRCERDVALEKSISAVRQALVAAKGACDEISPWLQMRFAMEASILCALLHESRGMVLEAEFLCSKAVEVCSAHTFSRAVVLRSMLCGMACMRRDLKEGKSILSKMRSHAKLLQETADHKLALSYYKEAAGDFHSAKWEDGGDAASGEEAYTRFKQAVALCSGRRALRLRVKQGVAMARNDRAEEALTSWKEIVADDAADLSSRALAQYYLGVSQISSCPKEAIALLESAVNSGGLDSVHQSRAATELALLVQDSTAQFAWACRSTGVTFSNGQNQIGGFSLPSSWTVISVSLVERDGREVGLLLSRVEGAHTDPIVRCLSDGAGSFHSVRARLNSIVARSDETTRRQVASSQDKKLWWRDRTALDQEMKDLLNEIESNWFGSERDLLRPRLPQQEVSEESALSSLKRAVQKAGVKKRVTWSKMDLRWLVRVFCTVPFYPRPDLAKALLQCCGRALDAAECNKIAPWLAKEAACMSEDAPSCHVVLVLGTGLERIPWESLPVLRSCSVSRMPSLSFLAVPGLAQNHALDPSKAFYILNPSNDLANTQYVFLESFRRKGWQGIAGTAPTPEQFLEALKLYDLFVYCGHNSGEQYLRRESIERKLDAVRPVSLLMGCSSAALRDLGHYEPCGVVQSYIQAKCPAVAGNLFDVTDADIDRFLTAVLDKWLTVRGASLAQCIADARDVCKLPYLVGSSPVIYGLPNVVI